MLIVNGLIYCFDGGLIKKYKYIRYINNENI